jgi:hypothetical protein
MDLNIILELLDYELPLERRLERIEEIKEFLWTHIAQPLVSWSHIARPLVSWSWIYGLFF